MKLLSRSIVVVFAGLLPLIAGCGENEVPAVARKVNSKPVFGTDVSDTVTKKNNNIDFGFLHEDHFACVSINIGQMMSHEELGEVPWESLQDQLASLLGEKNSRLDMMNRIWVLLDRESIQQMMSGGNANPFVFVVDYKSFPDLEDLQKAQDEFAFKAKKKSKSNSDDQPADEPADPMMMVARSIGDSRIVVGSTGLTKKLLGKGTSSELQRELSKLDFESDIEGLITLGPIRPTLKTAFGMAAQFGGEEAKKLAKLPDVLKQIELKLSMKGDVTMKSSILLDDPEMVKELSRTVQQAQASSQDGGGMGGVFGQMSGMSSAGRPLDEMGSIFALTAPKVMEGVAKQIGEDNLFSVEGIGERLTFTLRRPEAMNELIVASIEDAKRGFEFGQRAEKLVKVGEALSAYYKKHKCFPPAGAVKDSADGLPAQLNWRVGLLPFLDQQELYDQFDFAEAWDSEKNLEVAKSVPDVFGVKAEEDSNQTLLHYPGGAVGLFADGKGKKSLEDIVDRKIWTAIVVEGSSDTAVAWTKPGVLEIGKGETGLVGNSDENGVLMLNGSFDVRAIKKQDKNVISVLTHNGDEKLSRQSFFSLPSR